MSKFIPLCAAVALSCAVAPLLSQGAAAQEAPDLMYIDCQNRFAVIFPAMHMTRDIMYTANTGASVPAKQFFVERNGGRYAVTVVHTPNGPLVDEALLDHAANNLRARGEVRFSAAANYDPGFPGRQLNIFMPNGRQLRASVYMADRHMIITEADAPEGDFNALQFEQSITLIDGQGYDLDANANQARRQFQCRR
jgi:hypothetical protein